MNAPGPPPTNPYLSLDPAALQSLPSIIDIHLQKLLEHIIEPFFTARIIVAIQLNLLDISC
jgi:hypothetical protein